MNVLLQLSSGRGPAEVRRFVGWLARRIADECAVDWAGPADPRSATLSVPAEAAAAWAGTHELVAPLRGARHRKRWFVQVTVHTPPYPVTDRRIELSAARSGGPGGQNVNKRATAVRAVDRVSGIAVRAAGERSQGRNRAVAVRRLEEALERRDAKASERAEEARRAEHDRLIRGNARFSWRLGDDGLVPA